MNIICKERFYALYAFIKNYKRFSKFFAKDGPKYAVELVVQTLPSFSWFSYVTIVLICFV